MLASMEKGWITRKIFHWLFLLKRPLTLGVRVALENEKGEFLLVRHTYVKGWYLPGGGVELGETCDDAARKEVWEEAGIRMQGDLSLFGLYYNLAASPRDHVVLYHLVEDHTVADFKPNREIAEAGFFSEDDLPEEITKATKRRIEEIRGLSKPGQYW